jgi:hypothetical protein
LSLKYASAVGVLSLLCVVLNGCGIGAIDHSSRGTLTISGVVHGGQQPVSSSTIQLYTVGSSGLASASTPMLRNGVTSDSQGNFNIGSDYTCGQSNTSAPIPAGSDQVYIVASGGNPGLNPVANNHALVMMAAIGSCENLASINYIEINELTTVAAAWALAPFMTSSTQVGATSTNPDGIMNAFRDAALLVDITTGEPTTLPATLNIETNKLIAMADAIASCVNSNGGTGCTPLFTAAATGPSDTLSAALNIVKHPGRNVALVYTAIGDFPPFVTGLTKAPNDWTMSLTLSNGDLITPATNGGLASPESLAIDKDSNVWVAEQDGPLSEFSPQGSAMSANGYGAGMVAQAYAVAVDSVGDIWVANYNGLEGSSKGSATEFAGSDAVFPTLPGTILGDYSGDVLYPDALSADTKGNMYIADSDSSSVTLYSSSGGSPVSGFLGSDAQLDAIVEGVAADANDGFWISDNGRTIAHISSTVSSATPYGQLLSHPTCCNESYGLATDSDGTVWVADYAGGSNGKGAFAEVVSDSSNKATVPISGSQVGGLLYPAFVAVDGAQNIWFSNYHGGSVTEIAGSHTSVAAGTALSPTVGIYGQGGFGLDAGLDEPLGIGPDRSGNLWVTSKSNDKVVMFFGLAAPTATPVRPTPTAP